MWQAWNGARYDSTPSHGISGMGPCLNIAGDLIPARKAIELLYLDMEDARKKTLELLANVPEKKGV